MLTQVERVAVEVEEVEEVERGRRRRHRGRWLGDDVGGSLFAWRGPEPSKVPVPKDHRLISEVIELQEADGHRRSCV